MILGNLLPISLDVIQQVQRGRFVGADGQPPGRFVAQLGQGVFQIALQVLKAPGVLQNDLAGIGQQQILRRPVDQPLAEFCLSSRWIDKEIAGCVRSSFSAAREKLFSVATVRNTRSGCSSISYTLYNY